MDRASRAQSAGRSLVRIQTEPLLQNENESGERLNQSENESRKRLIHNDTFQHG
jgi:hypothetical protein